MKEKILIRLKQCGGYVSGQELCETFGVSRTAVWKHIKALKEARLSGVTVICTAHGTCMEDIGKRLADTHIFDRYIFLEGNRCPGKIKEVFNSKGERMCL